MRVVVVVDARRCASARRRGRLTNVCVSRFTQVLLKVRRGAATTVIAAPRSAPLGAVLYANRTRLRRVLDVDDDWDVVEAFMRDGAADVRAPVGVADDFNRTSSVAMDALEVTLACRKSSSSSSSAAASVVARDGDAWAWMWRECRDYYFNALKESTYGTFASASKVMSMSTDAMDSLYDAVVKGDSSAMTRAETITGELRLGKKRGVAPTRAYATTVGEDDFGSATYVSAPVRARWEDGRAMTVGDALATFGFDVARVDRVVSQGIDVDLTFDLMKTYDALRHVDLFLHLVVRLKKEH
jgi:hypothetical protein